MEKRLTERGNMEMNKEKSEMWKYEGRGRIRHKLGYENWVNGERNEGDKKW